MGHKHVWRAQNTTEEKWEILIYFFNMYINQCTAVLVSRSMSEKLWTWT